MSKDLEEVTRLINLYIDGAGKGNADKLNEAFHASARWFGTMGGVDYDMDKAGFVALMVESPGDAGQLTAKSLIFKLMEQWLWLLSKKKGSGGLFHLLITSLFPYLMGTGRSPARLSLTLAESTLN